MGLTISIEGIYYKPESKVFKDSESDKIVAYFTAGEWRVLEDNLPQGNCPLQSTIKKFFSQVKERQNKANDSVAKIFKTEFPKILSAEKNEYLKRTLDKTLIALELDNEKITIEQNSIIAILNKLGIDANKIENPHISISYLNNSVPLDILEKEITRLSTKNWFFQIKNIKILPGLTTSRDYVCFELDSPADFYSFIDDILADTRCGKQFFPGGFKSHISLIYIDKGILTPDLIKSINNELCSYKIKISPIVHPKYAALYNKDKRTEIRKKFKRAKSL